MNVTPVSRGAHSPAQGIEVNPRTPQATGHVSWKEGFHPGESRGHAYSNSILPADFLHDPALATARAVEDALATVSERVLKSF